MQQHWWRTAGDRLRKVADYYRKYHTIQAIPREVSGPRISARDRAQGRIPAVVFSSAAADSTKQLLTTEQKQIHSILSTVDPAFFCSTTFKLQVRAGSGSSVLLHSGNVLPVKVTPNNQYSAFLFTFFFLIFVIKLISLAYYLFENSLLGHFVV